MPQFTVKVTSPSPPDSPQLPDRFGTFAVVVTVLRELGVLKQVEKRLLLRRKAGAQGIHLFVTLLALFCSGSASKASGYLRGFLDQWAHKPMGRRVAALAGLVKLPSQASASRALAAVDLDSVTEFGRFLLEEALDLGPLLNHASVKHTDCLGRSYYLFDSDPTATGKRQRALPEGEGLPDAVRISDASASPGYMGRKRGEAKVSRPTLMFRGARLYFGADLNAGNGHWPETVKWSYDLVERIASRYGLRPDRCICCMDGETGGHPQTSSGLQSAVHFVTRLAEYKALQQRDVRDKFENAVWERVADSGSGPVRWATEFGTMNFGSKQARLVVSRFWREQNEGRGAGKFLDGWQYEVFSTDLGADGFPSPEIVTLYNQRAGIENYFSLEDGEFALDHTYCNEPGGQLLTTLVALFLHNLQILLGFRINGLPPLSVEQELRSVETLPQNNAKLESEAPELETEVTELEDEVPELEDEVPELEVPFDTSIEEPLAGLSAAIRQAVESRDDLVFENHRVLCLAGNELSIDNEKLLENGNVHIHMRTKLAACNSCETQCRAKCTKSSAKNYRKALQITCAPIDEEFVAQHVWLSPGPQVEPGEFRQRASALRPQILRRCFQALAAAVVVRVELDIKPTFDATHGNLYALMDEDRQHRRQPWNQKVRWNRLGEADTVSVDFIGDGRISRLIQPRGPTSAQQAVAS